MKRLLLIGLLFAAPCAAQTPEPSAWTGGHQDIADWLGTAGAVGNVTAGAITAWRNPERGKAMGRFGCEMGLAVGVSKLLKSTIRETRPDGSDRKSFPSEHSFITAAVGWNFTFQIPLAAFVGISRVDANKHRPRDVVAGMAMGAGTQALCRALFKTKE